MPSTTTHGAAPHRPRDTEFELILSLGLPTRLSWLDFTVEAIFLPFNADSTPELEFETNFVWLPACTARDRVWSAGLERCGRQAGENHR
jgi:hypothetical protein